MSWYRQIKTFYTISINMFFFIIWGIISSIFLINRLDYRLYFVTLAASFLLQFIMVKYEDRLWRKLIAAVVGVGLTLLISRGIYFIFNSIFIIFILYITNAMENEDVNYDAYKARAKNGLILILFLGTLLPLIDMNLSKSILKFYVMYLISNIIVMREARSYYYKIRNPRNFTVNIFIAIAILGLSVDVIFEGFLVIIKYIVSLFGLAISALIDLIGLILGKPMVLMINKLRALLIKASFIIKSPLSLTENQKNTPYEIPLEDSTAIVWLNNFVRIMVIVAVMIAVFMIINKFISLYGSKDTESEQKREKIRRDKSSKQSALRKFIKNIIKPGTLREQILNIYKRFEEKTFEKGIFKRYMTAKQLENITKAYVEDADGLKELTEIYNETKFSTHQVSEEKLKDIREGFAKVKKQL